MGFAVANPQQYRLLFMTDLPDFPLEPGSAVPYPGEGAYRFIDWLHEASLTRWQVLPLVPAGPGNSPYATLSALAGNPTALKELVSRLEPAPTEAPTPTTIEVVYRDE